MDPITIAVGAFTALKSGINAGKELHSMGQDLAKLWHAIDDVDAEHANAKKKAFRTVEEEAMETFLACLLYTSPSPRDKRQSRMPSSA